MAALSCVRGVTMRWCGCKVPFGRITQPSVICHVRTLQSKVGPVGEETEPDKPITFSTSKGSPKNMSFKQSMGSDESRPLWQVIPICLLSCAFLLWAVFRKETAIDELLYKPLENLSPPWETDKAKKE